MFKRIVQWGMIMLLVLLVPLTGQAADDLTGHPFKDMEMEYTIQMEM